MSRRVCSLQISQSSPHKYPKSVKEEESERDSIGERVRRKRKSESFSYEGGMQSVKVRERREGWRREREL